MGFTNEQMKEWFKDEFKDIKIRLSTNDGKCDEILRSLSVLKRDVSDLRSTVYGKDGMLERFTKLETEHCSAMKNCTPELRVSKKLLRVETMAMFISILAVVVVVFKDMLDFFF